MAGDGIDKTSETVEESLGIAHMMRLIDNKEVDKGLTVTFLVEEACKIPSEGATSAFILGPIVFPSTGWPKSLHAADHSKAAPGIPRLLQSVEYFPRARDLRVDAETPGELFLPLLAKGFWTSYEQAVAVRPR